MKTVKKENKVETRFYDELFIRLKDPDSDEFTQQDSIDIFYDNIIEQIAEKETELKKCLNSYHIDYFVYKSSLEHFLKLLELIINDGAKLEEFLADRRMSRVYEACLTTIGEKLITAAKAPNAEQNEKIDSIKVLLGKLGDYLFQNFETIIETQNGIFCLRCFLRVLGKEDPLEQPQIQQNNSNSKRKNNKEFNIKNIEIKQLPSEWKFKKYLKKFSKKLSDINVLEIGLSPSIAPCISLLLRKLNGIYPEISSDLIQTIHKQFEKKSSSFHSMIQDSIGSRFIESFLLVAPTDLLANYYLEKHIIPNIVAYSRHTYANYPIQTLLKHRLEHEPELCVLYDSLVSNLGSIIDLHSDLIYKNFIAIELITLCNKVKTLDFKQLIQALMAFFECDSEEKRNDFLRVLLVYEKLEHVLKEGPADQALFVFDIKPPAIQIANKLIEYDEKLITKSFNSLNANELEHLCTNNVGSHFIQQTLRTFHQKDRTVWLQSIYDRLKGRLSILSTNKNGSFVMETLWSTANLKQRIAIAEELKTSENQLKNDQYGHFLVNNIGLNFYRRKPDEWKEIQTNEFKKRKIFADILDDNSSNNKKQKK